MSQLVKLMATAEATGITAGAATSIMTSSDVGATCVRLVNTDSGTVTVGVSTRVGAATTQYFKMPTLSVEFLQKKHTDVLWTSAAIEANNVGFTN
tara:strand:+ start:172 stop:456 length:285 start_codon:yes stop_codon:yes gene_type:complete